MAGAMIGMILKSADWSFIEFALDRGTSMMLETTRKVRMTLEGQKLRSEKPETKDWTFFNGRSYDSNYSCVVCRT